MATEIKRMRYFDGLFLKEQEFQLDQEYNLRMRRLHNRHLHGYGIAWGLEVTSGPGLQEVTVQPGMAIDRYFDSVNQEEIGREIVVTNDIAVNLSSFAPGSGVYIWIQYGEQQIDVVADRGGSEPIHWLENAQIGTGTGKPFDVTQNLLLAKVTLAADTGNVESITEEEDNVPLRTLLSSGGGGGSTVISGGAAGKNYVRNPDAEASANNWTEAASLNLTVARTAVSDQVLSGTFSFQVNGTAGMTPDTDYIAIAVTAIDEEDKNQLMAVELSYKGLTDWEGGLLKVVIRDTTNNVDIIPNPHVIPGGQGKFRGTFSTSDSSTYELRLTAAKVPSGAFSVSMDSVRIGPNNTTVGAAIGEWTPFTLEITSSGTPPTKATNPDVDEAFWRRIGDSMEIMWTYEHTPADSAGATGGNGPYTFQIPPGYTIDDSKVRISSNAFGGSTVGIAGLFNGQDNYTGYVKVATTTGLFIVPHSQGEVVRENIFPLSTPSARYTIHVTVPIVGWSSNTVLSESRVEYVFNDDPGDSDNSTAFGAGREGAVVPGVGPAGVWVSKRVRFSRPYEHVQLEIKPSNSAWMTSAGSGYQINYVEPGGTPSGSHGVYLTAVPGSPLEYDVVFSFLGVHKAGRGLNSWSTEAGNGTRWRVVGSDNPMFVETAPSQYLAAQSASVDGVTSGIWVAMTGNSVILPPGEWQLNGSCWFSQSGPGIQYSSCISLWSIENGTGTTTAPAGIDPILVAGSGAVQTFPISNGVSTDNASTILVRVAVPTEVFLNMWSVFGGTNTSRYFSYIYAQRMS